MRPVLFCFAATLLLCSCSHGHKSEEAAKEAALSHMIYSPNGNPLNGGPLGRPTCKEAMTGWFNRVDTNHDGSISHDEFLADARIQFERMDIDHNGYLVSEELERYRHPFRQESNVPKAPRSGDNNNAMDTDAPAGHGKHSRTHGARDTSSDEPPRDTTDPVMAADTDLDFKVTPDEFMTHAGIVFSNMDANHDDMLTPDEVQAKCEPKP